jgi:hypothetical protein
MPGQLTGVCHLQESLPHRQIPAGIITPSTSSQEACHHHLDGKSEKLSVMRPAGPLNYTILSSFSKPMATPCRTSTEHPNPDLPREVPRKKEITQHTYLISKELPIAYPGY